MRQASHRTETRQYLYWPIGVLADRIQATQKEMICGQMPLINTQFRIVKEKQPERQAEIDVSFNLFKGVCQELSEEFSRDTRLLFPYIREIVNCHHHHTQVTVPEFSSLSRVMRHSEKNHQVTVNTLERIIEQTLICTWFTFGDEGHGLLLKSLNALEADLQLLIHLKFDILFQRVVELENIVARAVATKQR